ncbi:MAG: hypothetical protein OXT74_14460 [Candidatus Poribacteria bacterium]|nr:hypothetical protein [Candidatus Poribacteria bacterium]
MSEEFRETIEQWRNRVGAGVPFREQDLWKERVVRGHGVAVEWSSMSRRFHIKWILIAGLRAGLVGTAGAGRWVINE